MDFLVLDTETTALPGEDGSIVEIAILEVRGWKVTDRLHFMVKPTTPKTCRNARYSKKLSQKFQHGLTQDCQ